MMINRIQNIKNELRVPKAGLSATLHKIFVFYVLIGLPIRWALKPITTRPRPWRFIKRHKLRIAGVMILFGIWYYQCLPDPLFSDPRSTVVTDRDGNLLGARISGDGQWRFPHNSKVPERFKKAIITFEDKRFYSHIGVDFQAIGRALYTNVQRSRVVSGASTISMQVIRLARKRNNHSYFQKAKEMIMATRLELRFSKDEILAYYAANAPFGGNVVGLDAAAWKYYGRSADQLSWAESATLAVLPNAPSLIHPGKNRHLLRKKRDRLLTMLHHNGEIDKTTYELALLEDLPQKPLPLPNHTPHLTNRIMIGQKKNSFSNFETSINLHLQKRATRIVNRHSSNMSENGIDHAAALIVDVKSGEILAYVGNSSHKKMKEGGDVDIIQSRRSSGSILKPFLYASMLQDGELMPHQLVADVPTFYGSYTPKNYDATFAGAIGADRALAKSLNIPAVRMLSKYGLNKMYRKLKEVGITTLDQPAKHYGLSMILGGAEVKLEDLATAYTGLARNLRDFRKNHGEYDMAAFEPVTFHKNQRERNELTEHSAIEAPAAWHTVQALLEVNRPGTENQWERFSTSQKIAWKTGTSFGFRDAWAVGCTPDYVVAVWVGNANGQGRPELIGTKAAAPIMFELFGTLKKSKSWFPEPSHDMRLVQVCNHSGHLANEHCEHTHTELVPQNCLRSGVCPYCDVKFLDQTEEHLVHGECMNPVDMKARVFFTLPASMEHHYVKNNPDYKPLPPYREDCVAEVAGVKKNKSMHVVYPDQNAKIYIPVELDGSNSKTVFQLRHRDPKAVVYWHLDNEYIGSTTEFHQMSLLPDHGDHTLTIVDQDGETHVRRFTITSKNI